MASTTSLPIHLEFFDVLFLLLPTYAQHILGTHCSSLHIQVQDQAETQEPRYPHADQSAPHTAHMGRQLSALERPPVPHLAPGPNSSEHDHGPARAGGE
jgi:hypothetical protein